MVRDVAAASAWAGSASVPLTRSSAVVVEIDRLGARAILFDTVDGTPRFVALGLSPATRDAIHAGADAQVAAALRRLEQASGRRFLADDRLVVPRRPNGDGADAYYLTGAPVPATRVALVGLGPQGLTQQVASGLRRTPTLVADSRRDLPSTGDLSAPTLRRWLAAVEPTTVVLVDEAGAPEDWDIALEAAAGWAREGDLRQGIVVAGETHQQLAAQTLGGLVELSGIDPSTYRPAEIVDAVESEFRDQYLRRVEESPGFPLFSTATYVERIQGMQAVTAFLFRRMARTILSFTIGDGALLVLATPDGSITATRAEWDLASGARALLRFPPAQLARWLPYRIAEEDVSHWLINRWLRPNTELETSADRHFAAAGLRAVLAGIAADAGLGAEVETDLIALGATPLDADPALLLLAVLDGLMPNSADGVVSVALDSEGLMVAAGAIATDDPVFAREVVEQDVLSPLATCVVVTGNGEPGELAVRGTMQLAGGEPRRFSVPCGSLHVLPLPEGGAADLTLEPEPGFRVGRAAPGTTASFTGERQLFGGRIGIVIDARGRPLRLPEEPETRLARLRSWHHDLGLPTD